MIERIQKNGGKTEDEDDEVDSFIVKCLDQEDRPEKLVVNYKWLRK